MVHIYIAVIGVLGVEELTCPHFYVLQLSYNYNPAPPITTIFRPQFKQTYIALAIYLTLEHWQPLGYCSGLLI